MRLRGVGQVANRRGGCQPPREPIAGALWARLTGFLRPTCPTRLALAFLLAAAALAQTATPSAQTISRRLTANALRSDVSFLASDAMEGRATPSKSLDIAAEFIASQFRRAGLAPGGDDGYFQVADLVLTKQNTDGLELAFDIGGEKITVPGNSVTYRLNAGERLDAAPALRVRTAAEAAALTPAGVRGKTLLLETQQPPSAAIAAEANAMVTIQTEGGLAQIARDRMNQPSFRELSAPAPSAPLTPASGALTVWSKSLRDALAAAPGAEVKVTAHIPAPSVEPVRLRNVIGVLRGSDPALRKTYLILSAHYDHLGVRAAGEGDRIFNGANDNASSVASLIEIANALAALPQKPKRSIVFLALFGEEVGEVGSLYYIRHPAFPLAKTIADINLEQLGRTDGSGGPKALQFNMTGFDFTTLAPVFQKAAEDAGVKAVNDARNGDSYFSRSDNARFANAGIPSTTVSVTYEFPDYHGVGDEWPKLDYGNMAKVDCALALAAFRLANASQAPAWNAANPRAARYLEAAKKIK